ncbi:hypothetical protein ACH5RR_030126 [Cinchona calisaya]|uniref:Mitochondrial carrier protein n=1 Tax=Cinchona calisaya TaxID=153742 RepID=A0ABD2YTN5_9GENT
MFDCYIYQVVRYRLQEQGQVRNPDIHYACVIDCIKKIFLRYGLPRFYRGCAANLLRTTPSTVITFTTYEMINRFLQCAIPPAETRSKAQLKPDCSINSQNTTEGNKEGKTVGASFPYGMWKKLEQSNLPESQMQEDVQSFASQAPLIEFGESGNLIFFNYTFL